MLKTSGRGASNTRVIVTSRSAIGRLDAFIGTVPSTARPVSRAKRREMLGENVEAFAPAALVPVARVFRVEAGLHQRDPGALAERLEGDGDDRFVSWLSGLVVPGVRHHQALERHDL